VSGPGKRQAWNRLEALEQAWCLEDAHTSHVTMSLITMRIDITVLYLIECTCTLYIYVYIYRYRYRYRYIVPVALM